MHKSVVYFHLLLYIIILVSSQTLSPMTCSQNNMETNSLIQSNFPSQAPYKLGFAGPITSLCGDLRSYTTWCTTKTVEVFHERVAYLRDIFARDPTPFKSAIERKMDEYASNPVFMEYYSFLHSVSNEVDLHVPECKLAYLQYFRGMLCSSCQCAKDYTGNLEFPLEDGELPPFFLQTSTISYVNDMCSPVLHSLMNVFASLYAKIIPDASEETLDKIRASSTVLTQYGDRISATLQFSLYSPILAFFWLDTPRGPHNLNVEVFPPIGQGFIPLHYTTIPKSGYSYEALKWGSYELYYTITPDNTIKYVYISTLCVLLSVVAAVIAYFIITSLKQKRNTKNAYSFEEIFKESPPGRLKAIDSTTLFAYFDPEDIEIPLYQ